MEGPDIDKLYAIIAEQMEKLRVADTYPYSETYREMEKTQNVKLKPNYSSKELRDIMDNLPDGEVTIRGHTEPIGRSDFFKYLTIHITTYKKIEKVDPLQVKSMLMPIIGRALGLGRWYDPDCKLLALYKDGSITWEECINAHKETC